MMLETGPFEVSYWSDIGNDQIELRYFDNETEAREHFERIKPRVKSGQSLYLTEQGSYIDPKTGNDCTEWIIYDWRVHENPEGWGEPVGRGNGWVVAKRQKDCHVVEYKPVAA